MAEMIHADIGGSLLSYIFFYAETVLLVGYLRLLESVYSIV